MSSCIPARAARGRFLHIVLLTLSAPLLSPAAAAEGVVPATPATMLDQAANGVPVVNIATPDARGLSHNRYSRFDTGPEGLILNNSAQPVSTQLGGYITGNPRLGAGSARLILNEVTSPQPSQLNGYLEVAGPMAEVIVANPYGITCNGCGFINTPHATLATGTPTWSPDGRLAGIAVQGGTLRLDGAGLNADNVDGLALYARVLELNAALYAKDLQVAVGRNTIDAATGSATPLAATEAAPAYAIDSSRLGGMYADTIRLVGTEAGIGMRLSGPVAALAGSLEILDNGDVRLARSSAATEFDVHATGALTLTDQASAGAGVQLSAGDGMTLDAAARLSGADIRLEAGRIDTVAGSSIAARGALAADADWQQYAGTVASAGRLVLDGRTIASTGQLAASGLGLSADRFSNSGAIDIAGGDIAITLAADFINAGGTLRHSGASFSLDAASLDNHGGVIASEGQLGLTLTGASAVDNTQGLLQGNAGVELRSAGLDNAGGQVLGNATLHLALGAGALDNRGGQVATTGDVILDSSVDLGNADGELSAGQDMTLNLAAFDSEQSGGSLAAGGLLGIHAAGGIRFGGGELDTPGSLLLEADAAGIQIDNRLVVGGDASLKAATIALGDEALLAAQGQLVATARDMTNLGLLYGQDSVTLQLQEGFDNGDASAFRDAALLSEGNISIATASGGRLQWLNNYGGQIESQHGSITLRAGQLNNMNIGWSLADPYTEPSTYTYSISKSSFDSYHHCCGRSGEDVITSRTETSVTRYDFASRGQAAQIIAGGDIGIDAATLDNDHSTISAAGLLDIHADTIFNRATTLTDLITKRRIDRKHTCEYDDFGGLDCWGVAYGPFVSRYDGEREILPAILEGGTDADLHGTVVNGEPAYTGNTVKSDGASFTGLALEPADIPPLADLSLGVVDPTALPGFNLPDSGLFHLSGDPSHPYLIETDPAIATHDGFLGSAYLLSHLDGWSPQGTQQRLGDGYYELMLVRDALLASLGSRFIDPAVADEEQQFQHLMDNAIAAAGPLRLSPGIALSREQIDALQTDIVWMETREIAGQQVLVPVVYLAQGSSRLLQDGAVIGGGSLSIEGESFSNAGLVQARGEVQVRTTGLLENRGGTISAGGDLALQCNADILNESGEIRGRNVSLDAGGDILQRTFTARDEDREGSTVAYSTRAADIAAVTAEGELTLKAGDDIHLTAARVSGDAVHLEAGNDILLDTQEAAQGYRYRSADWQAAEMHVQQLQTEVTALSELRLEAAGDIRAIAATLDAGGKASLEAGGSLSLMAAQESDHAESHAQHDGTLSDERVDIVRDERRWQGTEIHAGGDLELTARQGDITLQASGASAAGRLDASAGGNLNVVAGIDSTAFSLQSDKSGSTRFSRHQSGFVEESLAAASLVAGSDLQLSSAGDVNLAGATLQAQGRLQIGEATLRQDGNGNALRDENGRLMVDRGSLQNLNDNAVTLRHESWDESQSGYRGPVKAVLDVASFGIGEMVGVFSAGLVDMPAITTGNGTRDRHREEQAVTSSLSGRDVLLSARQAVTLTGTRIEAAPDADGNGGDVQILGQNVVLDAAESRTTDNHSESRQTTQGLGLAFSTGEMRVAGLTRENRSISDTTVATQHQGVAINGRNVLVQAEDRIELSAATLQADADDGLLALDGRRIDVTGLQDTLTTTHVESTDTTTISAGMRNAYLDTALATKALADGLTAEAEAAAALETARQRIAEGTLAHSALKDYELNFAAATANLIQLKIALGATAATAVATSGTGGFYATAQAQTQHEESTTQSMQGVWQGSLLSGNSISLDAADSILLQGSRLQADSARIDADDIILAAGTGTQMQRSRSDSSGVSASLSGSSFTAAGTGFGLGGSRGESDSEYRATHYVNSQIDAGQLSSRSTSLTLSGAVVEADTADIQTDTLTVRSLQDTSSSQNHSQNASMGISLGGGGVAGLTGVNGSLSRSHGSSESAFVTEQSGIIVHDGAHSAIVAKDTSLIGGLISNATRDADGSLIDQGQLNFTTGTLTVANLDDYEHSDQQGFSVGGAVGFRGATAAAQPGDSSPPRGTPGTLDALLNPSPGTITIGASHSGHSIKGLTFATIGQGNVIVTSGKEADTAALASLNRDIRHTQIITENLDTHALDATATMDGRLLTEEGRAQIADEQKNLGKNVQISMQGLEKDIQMATTDVLPEKAAAALKTVDKWSLGLLPFDEADNGGITAEIPVILGAKDVAGGVRGLRRADDANVLANPDQYMPAEELPGYDDLPPEGKARLEGMVVSRDFIEINTENATYHNHTNGMMNTPAEAMVNAVEQSGNGALTQNYNARHGFLADILEIATDKVGILVGELSSKMADEIGINLDLGFMSGAALQTGNFMQEVMVARGSNGASFANHSQANILTLAGLNALSAEDYEDKGLISSEGSSVFQFVSYGSPVGNESMLNALDNMHLTYAGSTSNKDDFVAEVLGGNSGTWLQSKDGKNLSNNILSIDERFKRIGNFRLLLKGEKYPVFDVAGHQLNVLSPHSGYTCIVNCEERD